MAAIIELCIVCDSEDLVGDVTKMAVDLADDLRSLEGVEAVFVTGVHTELESSNPPGITLPEVVVQQREDSRPQAGPPVEEVALHEVTPDDIKDEPMPAYTEE